MGAGDGESGNFFLRREDGSSLSLGLSPSLDLDLCLSSCRSLESLDLSLPASLGLDLDLGLDSPSSLDLGEEEMVPVDWEEQ
jgi:hypothetical protein